MLACLVLFAVELRRGISLEADVLALLPRSADDPLSARTLEEFGSRASKAILFLVGHTDEQEARSAAAAAANSLESSGRFSSVRYRYTEAQADFLRLYFPYRFQLLAPSVRAALQQPHGLRSLLEQSAALLYSPLGAMFGERLAEDPLLLFPRFLRELPLGGARAVLREDVLMADDGDMHYAGIIAEMQGSAFSSRDQGLVQVAVAAAEHQARAKSPAVRFLHSGMVRFAARSAESIQGEVSLISWGSTIGLVVLVALTFRSAVQLGLGLLAMVVGLLCACAVSFQIFPRMHLIALAFGASLTGVCIDYGLHYLADHRLAGRDWEPQRGLRRVLPAITLGALTTILGYMSLALTDLPGLRQMAVFSALGVFASYVTVVAWFPVLLRRPSSAPGTPFLLRFSGGLLRIWSSRNPLLPLALAIAAAILGAGLIRLEANDDIRLLQEVPQDLVREEQEVTRLLGGYEKARFFTVRGRDEEQTLERVAALSAELVRLRDEHILDGSLSLAPFLPSCARQSQDYALLAGALQAEPAAVREYLRDIGFKDEVYSRLMGGIEAAAGGCLRPQEWLAHPAAEGLRQLWLGAAGADHAALVFVRGINDESRLQSAAAENAGAAYINKVAEISGLLRHYRRRASVLVGAAYVLIFICLALRYGAAQSLKVMLPPILAALAVLGFLGLFEGGLNLFHVISLTLLLGVSVDYAIFFAEKGGREPGTMFTVLLSAVSTLLSFGLLALCRTPLLRSFGVVLFVGVVTALLLSPWPSAKRNKEEER